MPTPRTDGTAHLAEQLYGELHGLAAGYLRGENAGHTLQPTALVHEAFLRLSSQNVDWHDRAHFLGIAANTMRRILVDHARRRAADKRGGGAHAITIDDNLASDGAAGTSPLDVLVLDDALERLAALDARAARVVELRFFGGLEVDEVAKVLEISPASVKRDWSFARAWLGRELRDADTNAGTDTR